MTAPPSAFKTPTAQPLWRAAAPHLGAAARRPSAHRAGDRARGRARPLHRRAPRGACRRQGPRPDPPTAPPRARPGAARPAAPLLMLDALEPKPPHPETMQPCFPARPPCAHSARTRAPQRAGAPRARAFACALAAPGRGPRVAACNRRRGGGPSWLERAKDRICHPVDQRLGERGLTRKRAAGGAGAVRTRPSQATAAPSLGRGPAGASARAAGRRAPRPAPCGCGRAQGGAGGARSAPRPSGRRGRDGGWGQASQRRARERALAAPAASPLGVAPAKAPAHSGPAHSPPTPQNPDNPLPLARGPRDLAGTARPLPRPARAPCAAPGLQPGPPPAPSARDPASGDERCSWGSATCLP
jgi:hypothetical protein